ncbi:MAG: hypothetical protein DMG96_27905 [Acidobacteria bacterium]|nr:MAG: hypothetical protein DMG96_27905 [Acidobacteriota bacterium]
MFKKKAAKRHCKFCSRRFAVAYHRGKFCSAACYHKYQKRNHAANFKNLTGQKFGRLTIIKCVGSGKKQYAFSFWLCKCDCKGPNSLVVRSGSTLRKFKRHGPTAKWKCVPSCGCSVAEGNKNPRPLYKFKIRRPPGQAGFRHLLKGYKSHARSRGLDWCLSEIQFALLTKSNCHYCGVVPFKVVRSGGRDRTQDYAYNGIDRADNSVGYVVQNCLPCCAVCNHAKHTMSYAAFMVWLERIAKFKEAA